jgi:hypothetical protein
MAEGGEKTPEDANPGEFPVKPGPKADWDPDAYHPGNGRGSPDVSPAGTIPGEDETNLGDVGVPYGPRGTPEEAPVPWSPEPSDGIGEWGEWIGDIDLVPGIDDRLVVSVALILIAAAWMQRRNLAG